MTINHAHCKAAVTRSVPPQISDKMLIQAIADGDKAALKTLYLRNHTRVYRFAMNLVRNESTAEEIVNEVFLQVWRKADQFEGKSQVATWLLSIARFKAMTVLGQRSDGQLDDKVASALEDPADSTATTVAKKERSEIVQSCIAKLAPHHREVITLIYYQGNKIEEVARSTGTPTNTIKTRMHHARNQMAKLLANAGVDRAWIAI
jgi:RNA polymerase sigma-70 factor (ECF subfamily)